MTKPESPLQRSIGLLGLIRWIIAVAAVIAIGAAFNDGHYVLGIAGILFLVVAVILAVRAWRARQDAGGGA